MPQLYIRPIAFADSPQSEEGEAIRLEHALRGVAVPVHPGAARYYQEHGIGG